MRKLAFFFTGLVSAIILNNCSGADLKCSIKPQFEQNNTEVILWGE